MSHKDPHPSMPVHRVPERRLPLPAPPQPPRIILSRAPARRSERERLVFAIVSLIVAGALIVSYAILDGLFR